MLNCFALQQCVQHDELRRRSLVHIPHLRQVGHRSLFDDLDSREKIYVI